MESNPIRFDMLFDADEYHRSGKSPWTFFAYPTSLSVERDLPPDADACNLLATLQNREICVAVWVSLISVNTTFFACIMEDIPRVKNALKEIEVCGLSGMDFFSDRSKKLFETIAIRSHPRVDSRYQIPQKPTSGSHVRGSHPI